VGAGASRRAGPNWSSGEWSLVIANVSMTGLSGPVFLDPEELALAPAVEEGMVRAAFCSVSDPRVQRLGRCSKGNACPMCLEPFQFHDLLEKVSDLLMENRCADETDSPRAARCRALPNGSARRNAAGMKSAVRQGVRDKPNVRESRRDVMIGKKSADIREVQKKRKQREKQKKQPQGPVIPLYRRFVISFLVEPHRLFAANTDCAVVLNGASNSATVAPSTG